MPTPRARKNYSNHGVSNMSQAQFKPSNNHQRFYAVRYGRNGFNGIVTSWEACQKHVTGFSNAVYKSFKTREEAQAFIIVPSATFNNRSTTTTTTASAHGAGASSSAMPGNRYMNKNNRNVNNNNNPNAATGGAGADQIRQRLSQLQQNQRPNKNKNTQQNYSINPYHQHQQQRSASFNQAKYPYQNQTSQNNINNNNNNRPFSNTTNPQQRIPPINNHPSAVIRHDPSTTVELYKPRSVEALVADSPNPIVEAPTLLEVYTDGACTHNGTKHAKAGYGVYFGPESPYNQSARIPCHPTNQRAEMTAVLEAMRITLEHGLVAVGGTLLIHTDSQYTQKGVLSWMHTWKKKGWKTSNNSEVKNMEIWMLLDDIYQAYKVKGINLKIEWVKGHAGVHGNEMADRLATAGIGN